MKINLSSLRRGNVQTVLLILIVLVLGGLAGGGLVYLSSSRSKSSGTGRPAKLSYPPGTTLPTFAPIVDVIKPCVVNIYTEQHVVSPFGKQGEGHSGPLNNLFGDDMFNFFFGQPQRDMTMTSLGSGVIVDREGYIITNNHVVEKADRINIKTSDGREYKATLVGRDSKTDIAVLKISSKDKFNYAVLGDSDAVQVGDWVLAVGNPFGYAESVSHGIISALGRHVGVTEYEDFIQTDAAINPGNSGGPLVNLRGEIIGINTVIATKTGTNIGIGFAIPSNLVRTIYSELKSKGKVVRGWLGVGLQDLNPDLAAKFGVQKGVRITGVIKGSPAEKGDMKVDDIVIEYNGKKITRTEQLRQLVGATKAGSTVKVVVVRNKATVSLSIKVSEMPSDSARMFSEIPGSNTLGLEVDDITEPLAKRLGLNKAAGVIVTNITKGSAVDSAQVRRGDVILEVNDQQIHNVSDFNTVANSIESGSKVFLRIYRGGYIIYINFVAD